MMTENNNIKTIKTILRNLIKNPENMYESNLHCLQLEAIYFKCKPFMPFLPISPCPSEPPIAFRIPPPPSFSPPPVPRTRKNKRIKRIKFDKEPVLTPELKDIILVHGMLMSYINDYDDQRGDLDVDPGDLDFEKEFGYNKQVDYICDYMYDKKTFIKKLKGESNYFIGKIQIKIDEMMRFVEDEMSIF